MSNHTLAPPPPDVILHLDMMYTAHQCWSLDSLVHEQSCRMLYMLLDDKS